MNVFNRIFDDQSQLRIRFESMAIDILFEVVEKGNYELVWSFILSYENSRNPYVHRRLHIESISRLCNHIIEPDTRIRELARKICDFSTVRDKDALHLAAAIFADCNYFITCDDQLIRAIEKSEDDMVKLLDGMRLYNPIDFLRKEMDIDVIE